MTFIQPPNKERFIALYEQYVEEIYQYILLRIGFDSSLAEDLTQDIFIEVYKSQSHFKGLCSERTWIYNIAKHKLFDYYRHQSEQLSLDTMEPSSIDVSHKDMEAYLDLIFMKQQVIDCLRKLPSQYQIVLMLKYVEEKSTKDISQILEKTPKSIESMLQRAKGAFIKYYSNKED